MSKAKPFAISKWKVVEAYKRVKANKGAAGVDGESLSAFEENLEDNLYKIWNRMSSGTYFPPPVRRVEIPKKDGRTRPLGIPTVADRVAQMVVKLYLEPKVEPFFHPDSYGYRPGKSGLDAVGKARERCFTSHWVVDIDIKGFFDNLDHELVMRAVRRFTDEKWILLYVERWLAAPVQLPDGSLEPREKGTPQGGVISPLLANLFLHLAFDNWMLGNLPSIPFERYADDIVVHCKTEKQANYLRERIEKRLGVCRLELHPVKTKIVYCKQGTAPKEYPQVRFTFLGYDFGPRWNRCWDGIYRLQFSPQVSREALLEMRSELKSLHLSRRSDLSLEELAAWINPMLHGWINYYGRYRKSALLYAFNRLNATLQRWAMRKYKKLRRHRRKAKQWLGRIAHEVPKLFAHWNKLGVKPSVG
jgi:group II intron reverse transcriptase/maturase